MPQPPQSADKIKSLLVEIVLLLVFNTTIAALLWVVMTIPFVEQLIWSQCIGISIFISTWVLGRRRLAPDAKGVALWPMWLIAVPVGALVGESIGAWIIYGNPIRLWIDHRAFMLMSMGIALAFGLIGTWVFFSRARMLEARLALAEAAATQTASERQLAETRLKLLQAQIEPHFLFNTLSNVSALIDTEPVKARRMLELFTRYVRTSLTRTRSTASTLGDEGELLAAYLEIQAMRMGARLQYGLDLPDAIRTQPLSPLLLQPLVENAIRHGVEPAPGTCTIHVSARREAQQLVLEVADTGVGMGGSQRPGHGLGLTNVRERLTALYGAAASLTLTPNTPSGLIARITIPAAP